jgi:hypothetical protein
MQKPVAKPADITPGVDAPQQQRLPCRGCTRHCANYGRCDGKPWRLIQKS